MKKRITILLLTVLMISQNVYAQSDVTGSENNKKKGTVPFFTKMVH